MTTEWAIAKGILNTNDDKVAVGKKRASDGDVLSERWQKCLMKWGDVLSSRTYTVHMLLCVPLDEVQPRQVDARKWLVFYSPFKLGICQSQMEDLQRVFHLKKDTS